MHKPDFDRFRAMLDQFAALYGRDKPDDVLTQAYWNALKDLPWEIVEACGRSHQRYGKFFPKPVELRPKDEKPRQDLPTGEAPRNNVRDYWRSVIVNDFAEAFGFRFQLPRFAAILEREQQLSRPMLELLNELEHQDKRDGRTYGQHQYVKRVAADLVEQVPYLHADNTPAVTPMAQQ